MAIYITGHSLGAARAALYAWYRCVRYGSSLPVEGLYLFGCPNPGDASIGAWLQGHVPILRSIKNGRDLVTDIPVDVRFLGEDYAQVAPFEEANELSTTYSGPFRYHHVGLYQAGCRTLPQPASISVPLVEAIDAVVDLYNGTGQWSWTNFVDGQYCAVRTTTSGDKLIVLRGSATELDWLDDFEATEMLVSGSKVDRGFWSGVLPLIPMLDSVS